MMNYLEANLDEQIDDEDEDDSSSSSSILIPQNEQRQHRCIKQMGKLTKVNLIFYLIEDYRFGLIKVLRPYLESSMDVEILEKFIEIIDENRPILSRFLIN